MRTVSGPWEELVTVTYGVMQNHLELQISENALEPPHPHGLT